MPTTVNRQRQSYLSWPGRIAAAAFNTPTPKCPERALGPVRAIWPANDRDAFRGRIRNPSNAAPILIIGMTHDPATPYVHAQRLTADLGNARLLTFDADGHGAATSFDPCVLQAVVGYVIAGVVPAEGAVCVQQGEPFPAPLN